MTASELRKGDRLHLTRKGDGCCEKDCAGVDAVAEVVRVYAKRGKVALRPVSGRGLGGCLLSLAGWAEHGGTVERVA